MARGWRVLDATSAVGLVEGRRGRLVISDRDGVEHVIPTEETAVLLMGNQGAVSGAAVHYLAKHDVVLLHVDWRGIPLAGLYPWSTHGRVAARHLAQASLSLPRRKNAWQQVVRSKVESQARVLRMVDEASADHLSSLARQVRSGDPSNVEAQAARYYWSRVFGVESHFVRDRYGPDPRNALLNYGYTVLRGYGIRAVLAAGLSPPVGLFHRGRSNFFNLVDDLIEPFRPVVDSAVLQLGPRATLEVPEVKHALVAAASAPFAGDGRRIPAVLEDLAQRVGVYVEGDVDALKVETWRAPVASAWAKSAAREAGGQDDPPW